MNHTAYVVAYFSRETRTMVYVGIYSEPHPTTDQATAVLMEVGGKDYHEAHNNALHELKQPWWAWLADIVQHHVGDVVPDQLRLTNDWLTIREASIGRLEEKLGTLRAQRVQSLPLSATDAERAQYFTVMTTQVEDATRQLAMARAWPPGAIPQRPERQLPRKKR